MTKPVRSKELQNREAGSFSLVTRSNVPQTKDYKEYRKYLRYDFFYSCAYCKMMESEAAGIRFTIDHYEPRTVRPDLLNSYENLMYACDICNSRKGDRSLKMNVTTTSGSIGQTKIFMMYILNSMASTSNIRQMLENSLY
jgi:5-methylcytosine-specific restriction endonuclease McrA